MGHEGCLCGSSVQSLALGVSRGSGWGDHFAGVIAAGVAWPRRWPQWRQVSDHGSWEYDSGMADS